MAAHIIRASMRTLFTVLVLAALGLSGCGGDGGGGGDSSPVMVDAGRPVTVAADEYEFSPDSIVVTGRGSGATKVRIELTNDGSQAHDLRVERGENDLGGTPIFGPGQTKTAEVSLPKGEYQIICSVADHEQLGMKGKLTVK